MDERYTHLSLMIPLSPISMRLKKKNNLSLTFAPSIAETDNVFVIFCFQSTFSSGKNPAINFLGKTQERKRGQLVDTADKYARLHSRTRVTKFSSEM